MFKYVYTFNPYECVQDVFNRMLITKSSCLLHIPDVTQVNRWIKEADLSIDGGSWSMKLMKSLATMYAKLKESQGIDGEYTFRSVSVHYQ